MNRRIVLILLALAATIAAAHAQKMTETYHQDSLLIDVETQEVVVQASPCLRRGDRNIYFPTAQQKQLSTNALGLLEKMQLNGLQVNSLFNTVEVSGGGTPVFCINGRPVELKDILALKPDEVARVEHNDNPGARFKDAAVVINYKLKQSMQGGGFMADLMEAVNTVYGVNRVSGKYNHKASEWSVNYDMQHAAFKEFYNENREEYLFDDNRHVLQQEEGIPGRLRYNHHWLTLNYNYLKADNRMLNVALRGKYLNTPKSELDSRLYNPELSTSPLELLNHSRDPSATTALDLYYQHNLPRRQTLILDFTGSYTDTDSRLDYLISQGNASSPLSRLSNNVDGKKYALIAEALYEKSASPTDTWSIGLKQTYGYANNRYFGTENTENRLHNSELYLYTEWNRKMEKWNLSVGMGGSYLRASQEEQSYHRLLLRPILRAGFTPSDRFTIRYRGSVESIAPTLAELSCVEQQLDYYQLRRGNALLTPSTEYRNRLTLDYHRTDWSTALNLSFHYRNNPIMEQTRQEQNLFVREMANQDSWQKWNAEYEFRYQLMHGLISLRAALGMDYFDSRAADYHHTHCNLYAVVNAQAAYKCMALTFNLRTHRPTLYGETLALGEDLHDIALTYFKKRFSLTLAMNNPFMDNYRIGSENWNRRAGNTSYQYVNETSRMLLVKVTYGMDFGRKRKTAAKRIQNEDTDTGILKGNK